jgi:hypothetical protein
MISRLWNVACLVLCALALMVAYQNWVIGDRLEQELVVCLDGR